MIVTAVMSAAQLLALSPVGADTAPPPTITSVTPTSGPAAGGTTITISGSGFQAGARVGLFGHPATNVTVVDAHTITATTPENEPGISDVVVGNPDDQWAFLNNAFTYDAVVPNDNFATAQVLTGPSGTVSGTTLHASFELTEPNLIPGVVARFTIWYSWTASATASATFSTCGSNADTVLAVYTGTVLDSLSRVAANDNDYCSGVFSTESTVSFDATAGTTYMIAVATKGQRPTETGHSVVLGWSNGVPDAPTIGTVVADSGGATVRFTPPSNDGGSPVTSYTVTSYPGGITATGTSSPVTIAGLVSGTTYTFTVHATNAIGNGPESARSNPVILNRPPDCTTVTLSTSILWPPDNQMHSVRLDGGSDPDGGPLVLAVTSLTQDEPVEGAADAQLGSDERTVALRAQRSGAGDGRVYRLNFTVSDALGATCSGVVAVAVPHSSAAPAIDSGGRYDSLRAM